MGVVEVAEGKGILLWNSPDTLHTVEGEDEGEGEGIHPHTQEEEAEAEEEDIPRMAAAAALKGTRAEDIENHTLQYQSSNPNQNIRTKRHTN